MHWVSNKDSFNGITDVYIFFFLNMSLGKCYDIPVFPKFGSFFWSIYTDFFQKSGGGEIELYIFLCIQSKQYLEQYYYVI